YLGDTPNDTATTCQCHPHKVRQYRSRISGPLADRIDLQVEVPRLELDTLTTSLPSLSSDEMRAQVMQAHAFQAERFRGTSLRYNQQLGGRMLEHYCLLAPEANELLASSFEALDLSARAYNKI